MRKRGHSSFSCEMVSLWQKQGIPKNGAGSGRCNVLPDYQSWQPAKRSFGKKRRHLMDCDWVQYVPAQLGFEASLQPRGRPRNNVKSRMSPFPTREIGANDHFWTVRS
jgi:hypothetical protein